MAARPPLLRGLREPASRLVSHVRRRADVRSPFLCRLRHPGRQAAHDPESRPGVPLPEQIGERTEEERRLVTALFCDLVGFTPLSERLDAEQVRGIQTRYFEAMSAEIARFGGRVEKFAGDAVLALFGVPVAHGDDAERAVLCAIAMHDVLEALAVDVARHHGVDLALRIGINTGEAVSGLRDAGGRSDYAVTGDVVNTAARFQTAAEPATTMAGEETMRLARKRIRFGERRVLSLKGKARPVAAYQVLGARDTAGAVDERSALAGRSPELGLLLGAWDRARRGEGQLVTLVADAGLGKSRLMEEVVLRAGAPVVRGRALSYGRDLSLSLIADAVRSLLHVSVAAASADIPSAGDASPAVPDSLAESLVSTVERLLAAENDETRAVAIDVLGEVLGLPQTPSPLTASDPQTRRQALVKTLQLILLACGERAPSILLLDDLHWIDAASAEVLTGVLSDLPGLRLLVLAAHRPGWSAPWSEWSWVERLNLRPLTDFESSAMTSRLLAGLPLTDDLERYVADRAGGNPFFIEELVRALRETGGVVEENGRMRVLPDAVRLPSTLTEILLARLDALDSEARTIVQVASVIGRAFSLDLLASVTGAAESSLLAAVEALQRAEVAVSVPGTGREYAFRHSAMRDVAYNTLLSARRATLHAAAARALMDSASDDNAEIIAYHLTQTDDDVAAADWLERAGDRSVAVAAVAAAMSHYEEARRRLGRLGPVPEVEARIAEKLAGVFRTMAWYDEALEELGAALSALRAAPDRDGIARIAARTSTVQFLQGNSVEAVATARLALADLDVDEDAVPSRGTVDLYLALVDPLTSLNRFEDALAGAWRALELARLLGDPAVLVAAQVRYGAALHGMGRLVEADEVLAASLASVEVSGDLESLSRSLMHLGDIALARGRPQRSRDFYERARGVHETRGDIAGAAALVGRLAHVAVVVGAWDEARLLFERSVEAVQSMSLAHFSAAALMDLGEHYLRLGETARAERYLEESFSLAERSGQTAQISYLQIPLADRDLREGRPGDALARLDSLVRARAFETPADHRALQVAAQALLMTGAGAVAHSLIQEGISFAEGQDNRLALIGWLALRGRQAALSGEDGEPYLSAALDVARAIPNPEAEARIMALIGDTTGDPASLGAAEAIFARLGRLPDLDRLGESDISSVDNTMRRA